MPHNEMRFQFHAPLACVMCSVMCSVIGLKQPPTCVFTPVHTCIYPTFTHVSTATSRPVACGSVSLFSPHTHISLLSSPPLLLTRAALSMSLTFGSAVSEVQSIVQPGLTDLVLLCGQNSDPPCTLPPEILQPELSTDQRAAWLKRHYSAAVFLFPFSCS